jgi:hypothetical protein
MYKRYWSNSLSCLRCPLFASVLTLRKLACSLSLVLLTSACSSLLPTANTDSTSFESFDAARTAIEALVPMKSKRSVLEKDGFNPLTYPNTKILTHSDVVRLLVPTGLLTRADLDPGILVCVEARDNCLGMGIVASKIVKTRTGNFLLDFSNFKRHTETTGWRFNALILFVNDLVVYRSWGGEPVVNETEITNNPLGPLQNVGPALLSNNR